MSFLSNLSASRYLAVDPKESKEVLRFWASSSQLPLLMSLSMSVSSTRNTSYGYSPVQLLTKACLPSLSPKRSSSCWAQKRPRLQTVFVSGRFRGWGPLCTKSASLHSEPFKWPYPSKCCSEGARPSSYPSPLTLNLGKIFL